MYERIIEKAKKLGINTSSGNSLEKLEEIALKLGINDFDPMGDLSVLENGLDSQLDTNKDEILETNDAIENLDDNTINDREEMVQRQPRFGEEEYNAAKNENGTFDKDYYKKRGEELDEKVKQAEEQRNNPQKEIKNESDVSDNKKEKAQPEKKGTEEHNNDNTRPSRKSEDAQNKESSTQPNKFKDKNIFDKAKDNANLINAKNERFQNKINNAKAKAYQVMHPGEALKDKAKSVAKEGTKKAGKAVAKATGKAAKAAGQAIINLIKSNPYVLLIIGGLALIILIILMFVGGSSGGGADYSTGYFDKNYDFNNSTVFYTPCDKSDAYEMSFSDFVIGATYYYTKDEELTSNKIKAIMIVIKTNALSASNYKNETKTLYIDGCDIDYESISEEAMEDYKKAYEEVYRYLFLSNDYNDKITSLENSDKLEFKIEDFILSNDVNFESILSSVYTDDNLKIYDLANYTTFYEYSKYNTAFWWPIGSAEETRDNIYGGTPTSLRISSNYGMRKHPISGEYRMHNGVDIGASCGSVLVATKSGTVTRIQDGCIDVSHLETSEYKTEQQKCGTGFGNFILIKHEDGIDSLYAHAQINSWVVKVGDEVVQGQKLGLVGSTGTSTGCHVHFEIRNNGARVNPLDYINKDNPRAVVER